MPKYTVIFEIPIVEWYTVEAENYNEATEKVKQDSVPDSTDRYFKNRKYLSTMQVA